MLFLYEFIVLDICLYSLCERLNVTFLERGVQRNEQRTFLDLSVGSLRITGEIGAQMTKEFQGKTILIVDDEQEIRELLKDEFEYFGAVAMEAPNGRAAAEILECKAVDVVITDIRMPGGDGIELLQTIKQKSNFFPIVLFMTAFSDITRDEAYHLGADAIFSKPFNLEQMRGVIIDLLQNPDIRWSTPLSREPQNKIEKSLSELSEALLKGELNIGRGGFFIPISTDSFPETSETVSFSIQFGSTEPVLLAGQGLVRWVRGSEGALPAGVGIEFKHLPDEARKWILDWIGRSAPRAFIPKK
jgi:two-component system response regulator (stage 0 sporulation protein F)